MSVFAIAERILVDVGDLPVLVAVLLDLGFRLEDWLPLPSIRDLLVQDVKQVAIVLNMALELNRHSFTTRSSGFLFLRKNRHKAVSPLKLWVVKLSLDRLIISCDQFM